MDAIHKKVLASKTTIIMNSITSPTLIAAQLSSVFCPSDKEEIKATENRLGSIHASQTLLSLLEKRGPKAFDKFLTVLNNPDNHLTHIADDLLKAERELRGEQAPGLPTPASPDTPSEDVNFDDQPKEKREVNPPSLDSGSTEQFSHQESDSRLKNLYQGHGQGQAFASNQSSSADMKNNVLSLDTLIKDIPYKLQLQIVKLMDPSDANHHDWRGIASVMNLSADDVRQLENAQDHGKMKGLIDKMIQLKKNVNDLLGWLRNPNVARWDVIDEIKNFSFNIPLKFLSPETESSEDQSSDSASTVTFGESFLPEPKSELKAVPIQEHSPELDEKPDARIPTQEEDSKDYQQKRNCKTSANPVHETLRKGSNSKLHAVPAQEQSQVPDEKPNAQIPTQEEESEGYQKKDVSKNNLSTPTQEEGKDEKEFDNKSDDQTPTQEEQTNSISSVEDDDVFENSDDGKKEFRPLLISCCGNEKQDQIHEKKLKKLREILEESWDSTDVQFKKKVKEQDLSKTIHSFIKASESGARKSVYFAYLVGPTVQINGENYLLPIDLKSPSSRADLIHSSLNINWLVKQLSKKYMQVVIVDGAYENPVVKDCLKLNGVLPGLAPIQPPPNAIIAFPCHPGIVRKEKERLEFITSLVEKLEGEPNVMLADLFDQVRADLESKSLSPSVEFALISSPLPICINSEASQEIQVNFPVEMKRHAILVSNFSGPNAEASTDRCLKRDREQLRMALLKSGWECEDFCDKFAKVVKENLRKTLTKLADGEKKEVMLYFMGHTKMIMDCNYFYGGDIEALLEDPYRSGVSLQWVLDLMCEKIHGPKLLVVDDVGSNPNNPEELAEMSVPFDVMISLPRKDRPRARSFTNNFARLLGENSTKLSLKDKLEKAAMKDPHRLNSNLLEPR